MNNSLLPPLWGVWTLFLSCIFVGGLVLEVLSFWPGVAGRRSKAGGVLSL